MFKRLMRHRLAVTTLAAIVFLWAFTPTAAIAHPLGNFTTNHFSRIELERDQLNVHYVVDSAEIPTFQVLQAADTNGDGKPSDAELQAYLASIAPQYADGLVLTVDNSRVPLEIEAKQVTTLPGAGGLPTLRVEADFGGPVPRGTTSTAHRLQFEDTNHSDRLGWREIVIAPATGVTVFNSSAFGNPVTDELRAYPQDRLAAPLDERAAELSWTTGAVPANATGLRTREGRPVAQSQGDQLAELIAVQKITPTVALLGLLVAAALGALHAFSPGHGKTVVGAYLVGARGTPRHAAFLGLTVTITHTAGVFALGFVTLLASEYVVPERLLPILSFVSGGIVTAIGLRLFVRRLRAARGKTRINGHTHAPDHGHNHTDHDHAHDDHADQSHGHTHVHSHGGQPHSHLPPGADGTPVTWRSLLALGISGGILPCPSALVVLLSAIALHRIGYGLLLVVAFSIGLAATLTSIGLAFVYAGGFIQRSRLGKIDNRLVRLLPVASAFVIMCLGAVICYEAVASTGLNLFAVKPAAAAQIGEVTPGVAPPFASLGGLAVLGLGLVFGLKHATEVDHVVAVSTIVSEHRNLARAALVGAWWGVGHTTSLIIVGTVVLALGVAIPEYIATWLEFGVALMIIGLGAVAVARARRGRFKFAQAQRQRSQVHIHRHDHDSRSHAHLHFHESDRQHTRMNRSHSHTIKHVGLKPLIVGAVHGLAGSAALTLLVLTQIQSPVVGLLYLAVFGLGSIVGMLLMSGLIGLPFALSARKLTGINYRLQTIAGVLSIAFGVWYAYRISSDSALATLFAATQIAHH